MKQQRLHWKKLLLNCCLLYTSIGECEREGSLDSAIRNEKVNPIDELLEAYPEISIIICNGRKSYELFQKHFAHLDKQVIYLPSTSNANRTIKEDALFAKWMQVLSAYDL